MSKSIDDLYSDNANTIFLADKDLQAVGYVKMTEYNRVCSERDRLREAYEVLKELQECSSYWSEYCVPIGIHDRIDNAITAVEALQENSNDQ